MRVAVLALLLAASGCALFGKGDVLEVRYYTPERMTPQLDAGASAGAKEVGIELGRISSGAHLREPIVVRNATYEVVYYNERRWTERPEVFVRRELARTLFEERGFHRAVGSGAPVVEVEVVAFEELKLPGIHAGRVQLRVVVGQGNDSVLEETFTVDRPIADDRPESTVAAIADALDAAAEQVASKVEASVDRATARAPPYRAGDAANKTSFTPMATAAD